jgi:hypothetical protein
MENIIRHDRVRNEKELPRVQKEMNILDKTKGRKVNLIGHILSKNCLLKQIIEGKIQGGMQGMGRQERRSKY